jgi:Domain of unknown function (DUF309)
VTLSLPLRNRLAQLILDAFDDDEARGMLEALARFCAGGGERLEAGDRARLQALGWFRAEDHGQIRLLGAHVAEAPGLCRRVGAAAAMLEGGAPADGLTLAGLLERAARLADHGLYFELHELLEPVWLRAEGKERTALQGLIQVAVAYHHAQNDNPAGAESLLTEGVAKLRVSAPALPFSIETWVAALDGELARLRAGCPLGSSCPWPRPAESPWRSG